MMPFSSQTFDGYSRNELLGAVQDELRTLLANFPRQLIQMGFFTVEEVQDDPVTQESLWHWLYTRLTNEFNGTRRARVHFFQEDLAASRASAAADYIPYVFPLQKIPYSLFPNHCQLPSFAFNCGDDTMTECDDTVPCLPTNSEYNNGITYQSNTPWSAPAADGDKVTKTLNGTPNDGCEGAYNAYFSEYLEVYTSDLDHANAPEGTEPAWDAAKWKAGLKSWKEYFEFVRTQAPTDPPAGLTVNRASSTSNTVSWDGVYGANSYTLQRRSLSPLTDWTSVTGCDPLSTSCTDTTSTGSQYAYRVQAANAAGTILSPWANLAVFLSEGSYDGLVSGIAGIYVPLPNVIQPGIQAGQGAAVDIQGFLSFPTSSLGSGATILDAKLRLKQFTSNDPFGSLGPCLVDIKKGDFNGSETLEALDFTTTATDLNVTQEGELIGVDPGNWVETYLDPAYISDVNNTDRTQFRIHFDHINGLMNTWVGWYSAESVGNEPQLLVRYSEP